MMGMLLALAIASGPLEGAASEWRPSGCLLARALTADALEAAEFEAEHGDIGASVSLECHYLARGEPEKALFWLRQSAQREPLTGQRYINYLLSVGGRESCGEAAELARRYLALQWSFPELNDKLRAQQRRANECR